MRAAENGHDECVALLVEAARLHSANFDIDATRDNGWTALMTAAYSGCTGVVRALCAAIAAEGAHPDAAVPEFSCATCQRRVALVDALDEVTASGAPPACCGAPMVERVGEKAAAARDARELMRGLNP